MHHTVCDFRIYIRVWETFERCQGSKSWTCIVNVYTTQMELDISIITITLLVSIPVYSIRKIIIISWIKIYIAPDGLAAKVCTWKFDFSIGFDRFISINCAVSLNWMSSRRCWRISCQIFGYSPTPWKKRRSSCRFKELAKVESNFKRRKCRGVSSPHISIKEAVISHH
jgi:hypothetical protein